MKNAIILLSGGVDSAVCFGIAIEQGFTPVAISFDYGQQHSKELEFARLIALSKGAQFRLVIVPEIQPAAGNYFPARNTIFLSFALCFAETVGSNDIFIGVNADDTFFPDCLPEYITSFERTASLATKSGAIRIHAPLIKMGKADIIKKGAALGVDFKNTLSCYNGNNCGKCASCKLRIESFKKAGIEDPIHYPKNL